MGIYQGTGMDLFLHTWRPQTSAVRLPLMFLCFQGACFHYSVNWATSQLCA
jgi:hypothetical protein